MRAYSVYVHPILEYNSVVWSPYWKHDIEAIERVAYNDALLSGCVATAHIVTAIAYDFCSYPALNSDVCESI